MSWLFEDPTTLVIAGVLIEGLLAVTLVKSGRGVLAVPMVILALLLGLCLLVERLVVTDREQIEDAFSGICRAMMANDADGVLDYIDPAAAGMRTQVRNVLSGARITDARIYDLEVDVWDRSLKEGQFRSCKPSQMARPDGRAQTTSGLGARHFCVE